MSSLSDLFAGDVVGPGFFEEYLDAENTLRKPFGSAEQNMYNFAYNLYNLKYLKATNQLDQQTLATSLGHLNLGECPVPDWLAFRLVSLSLSCSPAAAAWLHE